MQFIQRRQPDWEVYQQDKLYIVKYTELVVHWRQIDKHLKPYSTYASCVLVFSWPITILYISFSNLDVCCNGICKQIFNLFNFKTHISILKIYMKVDWIKPHGKGVKYNHPLWTSLENQALGFWWISCRLTEKPAMSIGNGRVGFQYVCHPVTCGKETKCVYILYCKILFICLFWFPIDDHILVWAGNDWGKKTNNKKREETERQRQRMRQTHRQRMRQTHRQIDGRKDRCVQHR